MKKGILITFILGFVILLSGCNIPTQIQPTPTTTSTLIPTEIIGPAITSTPTITPTALPSPTPTPIRFLPLPSLSLAEFNARYITGDLDLSPNGGYLAVVSKDRQAGDKSIWIWNTRDFTTSVLGYQMSDDVWSVAFSTDGKQLAIGCAGKIILLERETGTLISTIEISNVVPIELIFGPNHTLAFSDFNDSVTVWDLTLNKIKYSVSGIAGFEPNHFAISPDGRRLLTSDFSETHIWDYATGQSIETRQSPDGGIGVAQALAFSADGKYLAIGGCSRFSFESCVRGEVSVWESDVLKLDFSRFPARIRSLAFSTDNSYLAVASAEKEDQVELLDLNSRSLESFPSLAEPVKNPPDDSFSIYDMVFLNEKDELVVSTTDGIQLLDASTLSRVPNLSFRLRLNYPYQITASGDNLNLRTVPSLNGTLIQKLHKGDGINTVDGPVFADDFIWWKVKIQDGTEGWVTERPGWFQFDP